MGEVDRYHDDLLVAFREDARRRGDPDPTQAEIDAVDARQDDKIRSMSDAALIGIVLSAPLNAERTSLTEDRLWRVAHSIETLGVRDRIRGRDDALFEAVERAGRITTH